MARKDVRLDAAQSGKRDGVLQAAHQQCGRAWQPGGNLEPPHAHYAHQWLFGALAKLALDGVDQYDLLVAHMGRAEESRCGIECVCRGSSRGAQREEIKKE